MKIDLNLINLSMRERLKYYLILSLVIVSIASVTAIAAFFYGRATKDKELATDPIVVTNQIVVERITDQYFLVTKTLFLSQSSEIVIKENSNWSDVLWKKSIIAEGMIRVDVGVDISKLETGDIEIDNEKKIVRVNMPAAEVLDASMYGDLAVETESGLFTSIQDLFKEGTDDYNLAVNTLVESATQYVESDSQLKNDAQKDSVKIVELILQDTGYTIIVDFE
jgi:hypothetical protein